MRGEKSIRSVDNDWHKAKHGQAYCFFCGIAVILIAIKLIRAQT
jgi:hypothetical protein